MDYFSKGLGKFVIVLVFQDFKLKLTSHTYIQTTLFKRNSNGAMNARLE